MLQRLRGFPHVPNTGQIPPSLHRALLTLKALKQDGACLKQRPPFGCRVQHLELAPLLVCLCLCSREPVSLDAKRKLLVTLRCQELQRKSSTTPLGEVKLAWICKVQLRLPS